MALVVTFTPVVFTVSIVALMFLVEVLMVGDSDWYVSVVHLWSVSEGDSVGGVLRGDSSDGSIIRCRERAIHRD